MTAAKQLISIHHLASLAKAMTRPRAAAELPAYELMTTHRYELLADELEVEVDCPHYGRCYRLIWRCLESWDREAIAIVCHYQEDGDGLQPQTYDLDTMEIRQLEQWVQTSDVMRTLRHEMRQEALALHDAI